MKTKLDIFISTLGRVDKQITLNYLDSSLLSRTSMVVVPQEEALYEKKYGKLVNILTLPKDVIGLSANRQWLLERSEAEVTVFLDDDLDFHIRDDEGHLLKATQENFHDLINLWIGWLNSGCGGIVGVSARGGNNRVIEDYEDNTRIMSAYAFNPDVLRKAGVRFDRIGAMQDFDATLQLLELGFPNRVSYKYAHSQALSSGASGGCSAYRDSDFKRKAAFRLVQLHSSVVTVRPKVSKTGWSGMEQRQGIDGTLSVDVTIQWKKAYRPKSRRSDGSGLDKWLK